MNILDRIIIAVVLIMVLFLIGWNAVDISKLKKENDELQGRLHMLELIHQKP